MNARSAYWGLVAPPGYPAEEVVYVRFRGDWWKNISATDLSAVQAKLRAILDGPADKRRATLFAGDPSYGDRSAAIAPVKDLAAMVKKIDFAEVIFYDTSTGR